MRLGKRNFRNKVRYGFQPHFNKRGDRIPDPVSMAIGGNIWMSMQRHNRLFRKYRRDYLIRFSKTGYRNVKRTYFTDGAYISTVCLMLNHQYEDPGVPIIFETMIFDSPDEFWDGMCWRYATLSDAKKGHRDALVSYRTTKRKVFKQQQQR